MLWLKKMFKVPKPIIGMCHLKPLPNDPSYNMSKGIKYIVESAKNDIDVLQKEGFHGILISNEFSYPYSDNVTQITVATMARIIGELRNSIEVPFGVECMYDAKATIDLTIATDSDFYRITLKSMSIFDIEYGGSELSKVFRYAYQNKVKNVRNIVNINAPINIAIANNNEIRLIKTIMSQFSPDSISISADLLHSLSEKNDTIFDTLKQTVVFCDGGCNINNVHNIMKLSNGIVIGTDIKDDHQITNPVSSTNARKFMNVFKNSN